MNIKYLLLFVFLYSCQSRKGNQLYFKTLSQLTPKEYHDSVKHNIFDYINKSEKEVYVLEKFKYSDLIGSMVKITHIYKGDKVIVYRSSNEKVDTLSVDRNYILNDIHNRDNTYRFIQMIKKGSQFSTDISKCIASKDQTFISIVKGHRIQRVFRLCSDELIEIKK